MRSGRSLRWAVLRRPRLPSGYRPPQPPAAGSNAQRVGRLLPCAGLKINEMHRPTQHRGAPPRRSSCWSALPALPAQPALPGRGNASRAAALCLALIAIATATPATPAAPTAPSAHSSQAAFADQVLVAVNHYRAQRALAAWQPDEALVAIALDHSRLMAARSRLGHDGFDRRFQQARSGLCVETLAAGFSHADALVMGWRQSPTHHANLLEPKARRAGVASVDGYVTLLACD